MRSTAILNKFDVELPKDVDFKDNVVGIQFHQIWLNQKTCILMNHCTINENNTVSSFTNNIISYKPYKEYEVFYQHKIILNFSR